MIPLTLYKVRRATGGHIKKKFYKETITRVATDTRQELTGALFVPLKGERFDGHDYIEEAYARGAVCCLSEKEVDTPWPVITVASTRQALKDLARYYRSLFSVPVVAITGSVGKTTTKDLVAAVLSTRYKTLKTEGNFNNDIGLPLTIFRLDESYQAAVLEMGMNHFGEIHDLADIARPDICVITNIGVNHMEYLGSREGILKAKSEIFDFLPEHGRIILNGDDDMLITLKDRFPNIIFYGIENHNLFDGSKVDADGLWGVSCRISYGDNRMNVRIPVPGKHMVYNALAAAAVGDALGLTPASIKNGLESFRPVKMRMDIHNTAGGITVINDVYNASPTSVLAALEVLRSVKSRRVAILGDMLELGPDSGKYHYETGVAAALMGIELLLFAGSQAKAMAEGGRSVIQENQKILYFHTQEELLDQIHSLLQEGDTVLIKASRGMHLEKTAEAISGGGQHE